MLVSDRTNHRIQLFDFDGNFIEEWTDIQSPNNIHIDADHIVYIAEAPHRVSIFDLEGTLLARWGEEGSAPGGSLSILHTASVLIVAVTFTSPKCPTNPTDCKNSQEFEKEFSISQIFGVDILVEITVTPEEHAAESLTDAHLKQALDAIRTEGYIVPQCSGRARTPRPSL